MANDLVRFDQERNVTRPVQEPSAAEKLVVSQTIDPAGLRRLFEGLAREDCGHSWRNFGPDGSLEELLEWENRLRPTKIFFFHKKCGSELRPLAVGAVAEKLALGFPYSGFCVLGRCYIMPEFRGLGYYRRVLKYRLDYCRARFGSALNGVHIGSDNDRITRAISHHGLPGWPPFIHLGEEELPVAGEIRTVHDYMLFLPDYLRRIRDSLAGPCPPPCVIDLRKALHAMEHGGVRNLGFSVRVAFEEACARRWFDGRDASSLEHVLLFCRWIPLTGFK